MAVAFPFLKATGGVNFKLNFVGKVISGTIDKISPSIACASVLCVGRAPKEDPCSDGSGDTWAKHNQALLTSKGINMRNTDVDDWFLDLRTDAEGVSERELNNEESSLYFKRWVRPLESPC